MTDAPEFNKSRNAWVLEGPGGDTRYRLVIPRDFIEEELGKDVGDNDQLAWLHANLPQILAAYTARIEGGWVKSPWDRILVEEVE